jgi:hypothetical protein
MPDVKTFYPGATAGNPINNATDAVDATNATNATNAVVATTVDDQNATPNAKVWTGTAAQYAAITPDADTLYFVI